jgi:transposase-like protein
MSSLPLIPGPGQCCPVCSSPGAPCGWRSLSILYRCQQCGQTFILDDLGSLEEDLSREVSR